MIGEFFLPSMKRVNELIKTKAPQARIFLHSCGAIHELIGDFIKAGVDILNRLQPRVKGMDHARIKEEFGDKLSFHGAINVKRTLPHGTEADVEAEVAERIAQLGEGGGYIVAPANYIQADVPPENVVAMYDSARRSGRYPLD